MKKSLIAIAFALAATSSQAVTWWVGNVVYGNVCRAGLYYTVYPVSMGQPVGSACPVRDGYGNIMFTGVVTAE